MIFYECDNCRQAFGFENEEDVPTRPPMLEDGVSPFDRVCVCPECGDYIYETDTCELCGERAAEPDSSANVCKECEKKVKDDFKALMIRKYNPNYERKDSEIEDILILTLCD